MKAALFIAAVTAADADDTAEGSFHRCWSNADCPNGLDVMDGMFNGTCCGRTDFVKGDPYLLGPDFAGTADAQNADPTMGMCNAAATLNFGNIPYGGMSGDPVNVYAYLKHNWDTEDWARPYFISTIGNIPMDEAPYDFDEWASMIKADYEPANFWAESEFVTNCLEPRMYPEKEAAASSGSYLRECWSNDDCQGPEFEGGCCLKASIAWGRDVLEGQPDEIIRDMLRNEDEGIGHCTDRQYQDFIEKQGNEISMWENQQWLFDNTPMREMFFNDWPEDAVRPDNFEDWAAIVGKEWNKVYEWQDIGFATQCAADEDDMFKMWNEMDLPQIEFDMREDGMTIRIAGASRLAVSALTIAAMALY